MYRFVDCEMKRYRAVTTVDSQEMEDVGSRLGCVGAENGVIPGVRKFFTTKYEIFLVGRAVVDGEMECIYLITTMFVCVRVGVISRLRVSLSVPSLAVTNGFGLSRVYRMVDGEVESINLRTAVRIRVRVGVGA